MNSNKIGEHIAFLRKNKNMTQQDLGERLNISFQAVSKWERGETLPDVSILLDLAKILETTTDNILCGDERQMDLSFKGKLSAKDMKEAISCLERIGCLLGKQNLIYRNIIDGLSEKMNTDIQAMLDDEYLRECLVTEAIIQNIMLGYYFDLTEIRGIFKYDKWYNIISDYAKRYGIA